MQCAVLRRGTRFVSAMHTATCGSYLLCTLQRAVLRRGMGVSDGAVGNEAPYEAPSPGLPSLFQALSSGLRVQGLRFRACGVRGAA
eukprot:3145866-Rhodomonas_salina.2